MNANSAHQSLLTETDDYNNSSALNHQNLISDHHEKNFLQAHPLSKPTTTYFSLMEKVHDGGVYQRNVFIALFFSWIVVGMTQLETVFLFKNATFDCEDKGLLKGEECNDAICELDGPQAQKQRQFFLSSQSMEKDSSVVLEYGPYMCQDSYKADLMKSSLQLGTLLGLFIFMYFSDNWGRRISMIMAQSMTAFGLIILILAPGSIVACLGTFLIGLGIKPILKVTLTLFTEILSSKKRQIYSSIINLSYGIGGVVIAGVYFWLRDWRIVNGGVILVIILGTLVFCWVYLEESPRYLLLKKRKSNKKKNNNNDDDAINSKNDDEEIMKRLNRIYKINERDIERRRKDLQLQRRKLLQSSPQSQASHLDQFIGPITLQDISNVRQYQNSQITTSTNPHKQKQTYNFFTLFKYKSLRSITPSLMMIQFIINYLYITPAFAADKWGFSIYTSMIGAALSQIIGYPLSSILIEKSSRTYTGIGCFLFNGGIGLVLILYPKPYDCNNECFEGYLQLVGIFLQRISLCFYFSIFLVYVMELYPNCIRTIGGSSVAGVAAAAGVVGSPIVGYCYDNGINPQNLNLVFLSIGVGLLMFLPETLGRDTGSNQEIEEVLLVKVDKEGKIKKSSEKNDGKGKQEQQKEDLSKKIQKEI